MAYTGSTGRPGKNGTTHNTHTHTHTHTFVLPFQDEPNRLSDPTIILQLPDIKHLCVLRGDLEWVDLVAEIALINPKEQLGGLVAKGEKGKEEEVTPKSFLDVDLEAGVCTCPPPHPPPQGIQDSTVTHETSPPSPPIPTPRGPHTTRRHASTKHNQLR